MKQAPDLSCHCQLCPLYAPTSWLSAWELHRKDNKRKKNILHFNRNCPASCRAEPTKRWQQHWGLGLQRQSQISTNTHAIDDRVQTSLSYCNIETFTLSLIKLSRKVSNHKNCCTGSDQRSFQPSSLTQILQEKKQDKYNVGGFFQHLCHLSKPDVQRLPSQELSARCRGTHSPPNNFFSVGMHVLQKLCWLIRKQLDLKAIFYHVLPPLWQYLKGSWVEIHKKNKINEKLLNVAK